MGSMKKCDRCGKPYDIPDKNAYVMALENMAKVMRDFIGGKPLIIAKITECVDLYPECKDSLNRWFRHIEKPEEPEPHTGGAETCIMCGDIIPEGRQVCPWCACGIHNDSPSRAPEGRV